MLRPCDTPPTIDDDRTDRRPESGSTGNFSRAGPSYELLCAKPNVLRNLNRGRFQTGRELHRFALLHASMPGERCRASGRARRLNQQCRPAVRTHHTSHSADRSPSGQVPIINSVTSYNTVTSANTFQSLTDFTPHSTISPIGESIVFLVHYSGSVSGHEVSVNWTMFSSVV